jgi:2-ketocyclohexanecarboxyl-CoA hydrolase
LQEETMTEYTDILYEVRGGAAWITINRPDKYNAFRGHTIDELIHAFQKAGWDKSIGAIVLTGAAAISRPMTGNMTAAA